MSKDKVYAAKNFSKAEYYDGVKEVLGSTFFQDKEGYIEQCGYDGFLCAQLEKTVSNENIADAIPYINEEGQLCIIARIYSLAAADYYWHDLNLEDFELTPAYKKYMEQKSDATNESSIFDHYKTVLAQHPESTKHSYGEGKEYYYNTEYLLNDIDKNGTPELIVKEDNTNYYIYSFDGNRVISCGKFFGPMITVCMSIVEMV